MTTEAAAAHYLAEHLHEIEGRKVAIHNPHNKPVSELPVIYGFNNSDTTRGWCNGVIVAEDGTCLGGHVCSHEGYMLNDLGILEGCRPDRHETFRQHYPDGYRMEFVGSANVRGHAGLDAAYAKNQAKRIAHEAALAKGDNK
jgi:hypothetical protein